MHRGLTSRRPDWRTGIAILAIALVGATSTAAIWHTSHAADQDCAICQLRHQSAADLGDHADVRPGDVAEPIVPAPRTGWTPSGHRHEIPARAPPA